MADDETRDTPLPTWWKPFGAHRHSAVLQACAYQRMTAEQALDAMAAREQELVEQMVRLVGRPIQVAYAPLANDDPVPGFVLTRRGPR